MKQILLLALNLFLLSSSPTRATPTPEELLQKSKVISPDSPEGKAFDKGVHQILAQTRLKNTERFQFYLLDINLPALILAERTDLPRKPILISYGLIDELRDPIELAFVLKHEEGHFSGIGHEIEDELSADQWAWEQLAPTPREANLIISFFSRLTRKYLEPGNGNPSFPLRFQQLQKISGIKQIHFLPSEHYDSSIRHLLRVARISLKTEVPRLDCKTILRLL